MAEKKKTTVQKPAIKNARSAQGTSPKTDYDVIIIGTGMGGSAAGAISALHGMKTLILDKNPRPGGSCSYYEKQGFKVDTGTHLFIRGNKGPFGVCTQRLGMGTPIDFIHSKNFFQVMGMNIDITVPRSKLMMILQCTIPRILWQTKIHPRYYPSIIRLFNTILKMDEREIEKLNFVSVDEFTTRFTDNGEIRGALGLVMGIFFILAPWEVSAGEAIWSLQKFFFENNLGYPRGGASAIPTTFLKGAEHHGATLRLNAGVKKIDISGGKVKGVILDNGEKITARAVISTTTPVDTVDRLAGPGNFPKEYVSIIRSIKPSLTAVQAKIGVKKRLVKAGLLFGGTPLKQENPFTDASVHEYMEGIADGYYPDMIPIYTPVPTEFDPALAPKGCQLLTAVACAPTLNVKLKDAPEVWTDGLMNAMYQMVPGLKENIIFCDVWSVQTLANWIGKTSGTAYSTGLTPDQVSFKRLPHEMPVKGLYLAGDNAGPARGVGTELACQSGMDCADLAASHIFNKLI